MDLSLPKIPHFARLFLIAFIISLFFESQLTRFQKIYTLDTFKAGINNMKAYFSDLETRSNLGFTTFGFLKETSNRYDRFIVTYNCTGKALYDKTLCISGMTANTNSGIAGADNGDLIGSDIRFFNLCKVSVLYYFFKVYNRWGIKVVEDKDFLINWDGRYKAEQTQWKPIYMLLNIKSVIMRIQFVLNKKISVILIS